MSFFIIFSYFKSQLRPEKWQADLSSCPPHTVQNYTLAAKSFEKIDKNVICHFCHFHIHYMPAKVCSDIGFTRK